MSLNSSSWFFASAYRPESLRPRLPFFAVVFVLVGRFESSGQNRPNDLPFHSAFSPPPPPPPPYHHSHACLVGAVPGKYLKRGSTCESAPPLRRRCLFLTGLASEWLVPENGRALYRPAGNPLPIGAAVVYHPGNPPLSAPQLLPSLIF